MNKQIAKAYLETIEGKMLAIASEEVADRDGDVISIDGWDLKNFKANPVLMWLHMMDGHLLPIGKANNIGIKEVGGKKKLIFEPEFHDITEEAKTIKRMFEEGWLRTFSVGFQPKEYERLSADGEFPPRYKFTKQELVEISAVPIPALPSATIISDASKKGFNMSIVKSVLKNLEEKKQEEEKETVAEVEVIEEKLLETKAGRTLSKKNENMIKDAVGMLNEVLSSMGSEEEMMPVVDADKSNESHLIKRLEKMEGQLKHLIGEVQAYRKESKKEEVVEKESVDLVKILNQAIPLALKKVKTLKESDQKGGEK